MIQKDLPKFQETFNPILEILSNGQIIHHRELLKKVLEKYYSELPKELLDLKTKSGEPLILNTAGVLVTETHRKRLILYIHLLHPGVPAIPALPFRWW